MTICEKLFEKIEGSSQVRDLMASAMPDLDFKTLPFAPWLHLRGSEDLVLGAELVPKESQYGANWDVAYQFPHVLVYANEGTIDAVRGDLHGSPIIDSDKERALVQLRPCTANQPFSRITHRPTYYEAILEIRYTQNNNPSS